MLTAAMIYFCCYISSSAVGGSEYSGKYSGSKACAGCHSKIYDSWSKSLHAKALILSTEAVSLSEFAALLNNCDKAGVAPGEIKYAVGNHWTRRYVNASGVVLPFLYSLPEKRFTDYFDKNYRHSNFDAECIGCHVTAVTDPGPAGPGSAGVKYAEAGVGCEACHGPGDAHCKSSDVKKIINPQKLDKEKALMICMACHTNGYDVSGKFKYPIGYTAGGDLTKYFTNMAPKPGQMTSGVLKKFDYSGDNSFADRARQFDYWKYVFLSKSGLSCSDCLDFRSIKSGLSGIRSAGRKKSDMEFFTKNQLCLTCHANAKPFEHNNNAAKTAIIHSGSSFSIPRSASGAPDFNSPSLKVTESSEVSCLSCHQAQSVHDHKFIPESSD
ncbi:MAG TPA: multiheme c-type cytochrome [Candidatus Wallbacteria bacterium]|nr:multiheme c-type cytochrome [Candidatus Wallbacteria bacterium]